MSASRGGVWRGPPLPSDPDECYWQLVLKLMDARLLADHISDLTDWPREGVPEAADFIDWALEWAIKGFAP